MTPTFIISTSIVLLSIIVLLNLLLTVGVIRRLNQMGKQITAPPADISGLPEGLPVGTPAPAFRAENLTGELVTLTDYAYQAVSFIFIAPSCAPCVDKLPTLEALAPKARKAGVEMVLVNIEGDKQATANFVKQHNVNLPVLIAPFESNSFIQDYNAAGTPFFCLVDRESKIAAAGMFGPKWDLLASSWAAA